MGCIVCYLERPVPLAERPRRGNRRESARVSQHHEALQALQPAGERQTRLTGTVCAPERPWQKPWQLREGYVHDHLQVLARNKQQSPSTISRPFVSRVDGRPSRASSFVGNAVVSRHQSVIALLFCLYDSDPIQINTTVLATCAVPLKTPTLSTFRDARSTWWR
jgi:hypothetical protein